MTDLSGSILNEKYELIRLVGEGGMGAVYEAKHKLIGRRLAVKFLHSQYVTSEEVVTRFQREAQAAAAIGHDNIIEVTDMGQDDEGAPYIVMELLDGMDVRELIADKGFLPPDRAAYIMVQALSALHAAHEAGIIHRDLKPENIFLIDKSGQSDYVKLLDFGISKFRSLETEGSKGLTQTGTVLGTPYYMSPEQARGDQNLGPRSDIYAMGIILYQMLTGQLPYDAPNYNALLIKILTEDAPDPKSINPDLPDDLVETINIAISKDFNERFEDCIEFRQRLLSYVPGSSGLSFDTGLSSASRTAVQAALSSETQTPLEMARSGVTAPKSRLPLIIGGVAIVLAAVVAVFFLVGRGGGDQSKPVPATVPIAAPLTAPTPQEKPVKKEPKKIQLNIAAVPSTAKIEVDGTAMDDNPYSGPVSKDTALHQIVVTAKGYQTETAEVLFDQNQMLYYKLEKIDSERRRSRSSSRGKSKSRSSSSHRAQKAKETTSDKPEADKPSKSRTKRPRRKIDDEDPWG